MFVLPTFFYAFMFRSELGRATLALLVFILLFGATATIIGTYVTISDIVKVISSPSDADQDYCSKWL